VTPRDRHVDERGAARMVDVGAKPESTRMARAHAVVTLGPHAMGALSDGALAKGDAMAVARIAAIQAAKRTPDLVPLCHPLVIDHVAAELALDAVASTVTITTEVRAIARTGVEMEALAAATAGALAIYDMTKGEDGPAPVITEVRLLEKIVTTL
jgi:cyclic pyranopterin monophosphate synthase